jgi:predicted nuclease with TOPRIM domain
MTKELLSYVRVEDMRLQIRVFRDMEKARVQLKAEKTRLTNKLTDAVKRHFSLQERLEMGGSDEGLSREDIRSLDMEIAQIWERMLDMRAEMFEMETGSFRAAVKKLPSLEQRVEEIVGKLVKDKNSRLVSMLLCDC